MKTLEFFRGWVTWSLAVGRFLSPTVGAQASTLVCFRHHGCWLWAYLEMSLSHGQVLTLTLERLIILVVNVDFCVSCAQPSILLLYVCFALELCGGRLGSTAVSTVTCSVAWRRDLIWSVRPSHIKYCSTLKHKQPWNLSCKGKWSVYHFLALKVSGSVVLSTEMTEQCLAFRNCRVVLANVCLLSFSLEPHTVLSFFL